MLDKTEIAACLPHEADMLLLDAIKHIDENSIEAIALIDNQQPNPLIQEGKLGCWNLIEYGAQAAAVHLTQKALSKDNDEKPKGGYLMQVKSAEITERYISNGVLTLTATCISALPSAAMYQIEVTKQSKTVLTANITFALNP